MAETVYPAFGNAKIEALLDPFGRELGYYDGKMNAWFDRDFWVAGQMFAQSYPNETYFLHHNVPGSDVQLTGHSGTPTLDILYDPWGGENTHIGYESDSHFAGFEQTGGNLNPTPTRRYANPMGRWLTPDLLGGDITNPQSLNRYAYVLNNPTTLTDPSGLGPCPSINGMPTICITSNADGDGNTPPGLGGGIGECSSFGCTPNCSIFVCGAAPWNNNGGGGGTIHITSYGTSGGGSASAPPVRPPVAPPNVSLCANIAKGMDVSAGASTAFSASGTPSLFSKAFGSVAANVWLAHAAQTGGQFDYKQQGFQYVDFGNFNFGAVCAGIGDSLTTCQSGAGVALMTRFSALKLVSPFTKQNPQYGGKGVPFFEPPYGDQPNDSAMIAAGYAYAQSQACHG